jgi:hypothetical protein
MNAIECAYIRQTERLNEALRREHILMTLYFRLRKDLENYGPVPPFKRIVDEHMTMIESCGYPDPLAAEVGK